MKLHRSWQEMLCAIGGADRSRVLRVLTALAALVLIGSVVTILGIEDARAEGRVVILGFDGADASLAEQWMDEGRLPNLAGLRTAGDFHPLTSTNPPQTPVSWASFSTGLDPGSHQIFDFLKRIPGTYFPDFALMSESRQTLLWGERTPLVLGVIGLGVGLVMFLLILALLRQRGTRLLLTSAVFGILLGGAGYWFASSFLPSEIPYPVNNRQGLTFWDYADSLGIKTRTIRVPTTFPASEVEHGTFLSGLGVPDIRGRIGTPAMYTSREVDPEEYNDFSVEVVEVPYRGRVETRIFGPRNLPFYTYKLEAAETKAREKGENPQKARDAMEEKLKKKGVPEIITIPLVLDVKDDRVHVEAGGYSFDLGDGEWSEWLHFKFPFNPIMAAKGIGRFKVESLEPEVRVYFSPIHFDPSGLPPNVKLTHPTTYAKEIYDEIGPYKTMGWSIDTWSLEEEHIGEDTFLEDVDESVAHFRRMFDRFIEDEDVRLFTQIFYFTDRVQHMLWRLRDKDHPFYNAQKAAAYEKYIFDSYRRMDEIVGVAMEELGDGDHLIVLSDHGFATWRRAMNLNTWLARNGYMTLTGKGERKDLEALFDKGSFWPNVDWNRTKAFALGLGYIYINVLGREPRGTVMPGPEYDRLCREIAAGLEAYVDSTTMLHPVSKVYHRSEMYREGFDTDLIPDLRVCNNPGYRVSWQSSLGNTPSEVLYDVMKNWSGDHCSLDPKYVRGILFTSFPVEREDPWIGDLFATICDLLGIETPDVVQGKSLVPDGGL